MLDVYESAHSHQYDGYVEFRQSFSVPSVLRAIHLHLDPISIHEEFSGCRQKKLFPAMTSP
jgi:hypothetical protein